MSESDGGKKYYGKYRGTVINNVDPMMLGRLLVEVPDVVGLVPSSWAVPCVPLAGPTGPPMGVYMVPLIGAGVWIEFEQGNPDYPIWVGCRWGLPSDIPTAAVGQSGRSEHCNSVVPAKRDHSQRHATRCASPCYATADAAGGRSHVEEYNRRFNRRQ